MDRGAALRSLAQNIYSKSLLFVALLLFWIAVTGEVTSAYLLGGAACSALAVMISSRLMPERRAERLSPLVALRFPFFLAALAAEIVRANFAVAAIILKPSLPIDPRVVEYRTFLEGELARTVLAGVFTLTPGTVTLQVEGGVFQVHCLSPRYEQRLRRGRLERLVAWLFGEASHA